VSGSEPQYIPRDQLETFARYRALVRLSELAFRVPGTQWRFGIDPLLGLVPGLGDLLGGLLAGYGVWLARRMGAPTSLQLRMLGNIGLDAFAGSVPMAGDLLDFAFKAQLRNQRLLEHWLAEPRRAARQSDWLVGAAAIGVLGLLAGSVALAIFALRGLAGLFARPAP
jgi:hypothetical protein